MVDSQIFNVSGITVGYDDVGSGANALLLVHGHPFDRSMWQPQVETFAQSSRWRVIAPDLRGYGESSVVPGKTTFDAFAAEIATTPDRLCIARDPSLACNFLRTGQ